MAIARALVTHPALLLLDEPLAALDAKLREEMQIELINLQKEVNISFIYVTHDQTEALALSHRIAVMNQGHVEQLDEPSRIYSAPRTRFVADFIGTCNLLEGNAVEGDGAGLVIDVPDLGRVRAVGAQGVGKGSTGVIALRPEKIQLGRKPPRGPGPEPFRRHRQRSSLHGRRDRVHRDDHPRAQDRGALANSAPGRTKLFEVGDAVELAWPVDAGHVIAA